MDLKTLKAKMSKMKKSVDKLDVSGKKDYSDKTFFKPTQDSDGNVSCIIRFLPQKDVEDVPYVVKNTHFINASGKIFGTVCSNDYENDTCPLCKKAEPLWQDYWSEKRLNNDNKEHPDVKNALKEALKYTKQPETITNILVIKNKNDPDTEGTVFKYKMPKVVLTKYNSKVKPDADEIDEPVYVFDPFEGRHFQLKGRTKVVSPTYKFIDYEESYFSEKSQPISDDDEKILKAINEAYDLNAYIEKEKPDVEDVEKRFKEFQKFLGENIDKEPKEKKPSIQENIEEELDNDDELENVEEIDDDDIDSLFEDLE